MNNTFLALICGLALSLGIWIALAGFTQREEAIRPDNHTPPFSGILRLLGMTPGGRLYQQRFTILVSVGLGFLIGVLSGWYVLIVVLPAAVVGLPAMFRKTTTAIEVEILSDLSAWVRAMIGALSGGAVGLEQAIRATLGAAPARIQPSLARLVARLEAQQPIKPALLRWADEMNDYSADLIAATLILESDNRAGAITEALRQLANSLNAQAKARRAIENDRASSRATVRWVTVITLVVLGFASTTGILNGYLTPFGQILALFMFGAYVACLLWMRAVSLGRPIPRFMSHSTVGDQ